MRPTKRPKGPTSWYCCALSESASSGAAPSLAAASALSSGDVQPTCSIVALPAPSPLRTVARTTVGGRTCELPKRQRGSTRFSRAAASSELPPASKVTAVAPCSGPTAGWSAWLGSGLGLGLGLGLGFDAVRHRKQGHARRAARHA